MLAAHCDKYSAYFHRRLQEAGLKPSDIATPDGLIKLPVLERRALQQATDFFSTSIPDAHMPIGSTTTSGSTGEPVVIQRTRVSNLQWLATTMRDHAWHHADFSQPLASVRATISQSKRGDKWGPPVSLLHKSGPAMGIPITKTGEELYAILSEFKPGNLLIYPGSLGALGDYCAQTDSRLPSIKIIRTLGETVSDDLRQQVRDQFGLEIFDSYSSQEFGCITLQCPQTGLYHIMAENLLVEVLNDDGQPCKPGESGRVVITDLQNLATPLVRYAIGDYAEVGEACSCGRGLPTLKRILGRARNLILMPDGRRHWPLVGFTQFQEIAPILQYQFIQHSRTAMLVNLSVSRALTEQEKAKLHAHIQTSLGYPFELKFKYFSTRLPVEPSGKFEDFLCQV